MCHKATLRAVAATLLSAAAASAQQSALIDWRRIGATVVESGLASPAGGAVERVWYSADGKLLVRTASGATFTTSDFETWTGAASNPPATLAARISTLPEASATARIAPFQPARVYAAGRHAYRSDDGGLNWRNLTAWRDRSLIGGPLLDIAVSPLNPDEIAVANTNGIWRSVDGGLSWSGLNEGLPNLPARRILAVGSGAVRVAGEAGEFQWTAAERIAWRAPTDPILARELALRSAVSGALAAQVTALGASGDVIYAGSADGRLWISRGSATGWEPLRTITGLTAIDRIVTDDVDPLFAVVLARAGNASKILRTRSGGAIWDDLTANLQSLPIQGVAADRESNTVYAASARGIHISSNSGEWTLAREGAALDVALDAPGNQLYVIVEGRGVFAAMAPHRLRDPRLVSAGDRRPRALAPGALMSLLGARITAARSGDATLPVLAATDSESQLQVPFEASGSAIALSLTSPSGVLQYGAPLQRTAPSIFLDRDGQPLIVNADTGLMLDVATPARSGMRVQIFATGLGRVRPDWPTGLAAPLENSPSVIAPIRVYLNREPLEIRRAILAPGYVGLYLIEVVMPGVLNIGPAELYVEADTQQSNRVPLYLEP